MATATFYPSYDGFVEYAVDLKTCIVFIGRNTTSATMRLLSGLGSIMVPDSGVRDRGFIDFDISGITVANITKVELKISVSQTESCGDMSEFVDIGSLSQKAVLYANTEEGNTALWGDCGGAEYLSNQSMPDQQDVNTEYTVDLGAQAVTDIKAQSTWFSVSIMLNPETIETATYKYIVASETTGTTWDPKLVVTYSSAARRRILGG